MFYKLIGKDTYTIGTSSSSVVVNGGDNEVKEGLSMTSTIKTYPTKSITVKMKKKNIITETLHGNIDVIVILDCHMSTMPYHNNNGTSSNYISEIMSAMQGKGNLGFILTCEPNNVYDNPTDTVWIYDAITDSSAYNYNKSFIKAFQWLENKTGNRCIVFLSYTPDQSYLTGAIEILKTNSSKYDYFFTTYCCGPGGIASQWHSAIGTEKSGGDLGTGGMHDRFQNLTTKTVEKTIYVDSGTEELEIGNDKKVILSNWDKEYPIKVSIDSIEYEVGKNISDNIVYFDNTKGEYVLDFQMLIDILNIKLEKWNSSNINLEYAQL